MGKLTYTALTSLDGYVEDEKGQFDWAMPGEDVHRFVNDLERQNAVLLYGRKIYETMVFWESEDALKDFPDYIQEYGRIWRSAEKVVYSHGLTEAKSARTTFRASLDADEVIALKARTSGNLALGGANLASQALALGLVDEVSLIVFPVVVGGGKPAFGRQVQAKLTLVETRNFEGGVVLLRYTAAKGEAV